MKISAERMEVLREHIRAESEHDMDALLAGMTSDCFNDVVGVPKPFVGPEQTAERYRNHWEGFPDFTVRVRRVLSVDESTVVAENEWRGNAGKTDPPSRLILSQTSAGKYRSDYVIAGSSFSRSRAIPETCRDAHASTGDPNGPVEA